MDNQATSPQFIFPNVPDDFCPSGNWTEVLQLFIDEVLANGTINVPGLGDVNPQKIEEIENELTDLQNQVDAITDPLIFRGTATGFAVGAGVDSTVAVSFPAAMPTTNYIISLTPIIPGAGLGTAAPIIGILAASKAVGGFTISLQNNGALGNAVTDVEWGAIHP
jgi:hypothetical protein